MVGGFCCVLLGRKQKQINMKIEIDFNNLIKNHNTMSGGAFDYIQGTIKYEVLEELDRLIKKNGKKKTKEELKDENWYGPDWYEKFPEDLYHPKYSKETIKEFKKGRNIVAKAIVYIERIDYLLSGDDGEESFHKRLKEDLANL